MRRVNRCLCAGQGAGYRDISGAESYGGVPRSLPSSASLRSRCRLYHQGIAKGSNHHIFGLDVAVNDPSAVREANGVSSCRLD